MLKQQHTITMLQNMLQTCLHFGKSEPHYAYKLYAYIKQTWMNSAGYEPHVIKTAGKYSAR